MDGVLHFMAVPIVKIILLFILKGNIKPNVSYLNHVQIQYQ